MNYSNHNNYDVTIVGAGPTGSILAYELARQGVKVLLLEKNKLPRQKVCAGGVTVRATSILPFDFTQLVENVIYGVRLSYKLVTHRVRRWDKPLAYMVSRDKFDYFLASKAVEAGAVLEEEVEVQQVAVNGQKVMVKTSVDTFSTPILVGADGANSAVVRSLGLRSRFEYGAAINGHIPASEEVYSRWDGLMGLDYGILGGYSWVFPKKGCLAVGAGSSFREAKKLRPYTLRLIEAFGLGSVDERDIQGHLMPLKKATAPLVYQRVLLIGDAGGVMDPLTGEGIFYGVKSSYLAADSILKFLQGKTSDLAEYNEAINREIMPELKISRTVQKLNSLTPRIFYTYLENDDRFFRAFCRMLRGEINYQYLKTRLSPPVRFLFRFF